MKRFTSASLIYALYPLLSSLFIIAFLVVFLPFDLNRSSTKAMVNGLLIIGTTHTVLLYLYRHLVSLKAKFTTYTYEFLALLPFFILSAAISMSLHIVLGWSTLRPQVAWEWFYGSMMVLPIPHLIKLFAMRTSIFHRLENTTFEGINIDHIFYLRALGNYIELVYSDDTVTKKKIVRATISSVEDTLRFQFIRCHRSYLINPKQKHELIGNARNHRVALNINGEQTEIPVSPKKYPLLVGHKP